MKKTLAAIALMMSFSLVSTAQPVPQEETWTPSSNGSYHSPAVVGGNENGKNLILCAGYKNKGYHPGKIVGQNCNFGWGGKEILTSSYYTLRVRDISRYSWTAASNGQVPANAVKGGYENGHPLYICRAAHKGGVHPGKIVGRNCNFGWGGAEILSPNYHVLVRR
jgi:hypothetical protein